MNQRFSVVMPVRNALPYLDAAIESILGQTRADFEFIIGDDGSSDGSRERLEQWAASDGRIRLLESSGRLGPVGSANRVAMAASCAIVARMDADDISHPDRFRLQLDALAAHPDAAMMGTLFDCIDARGKLTRGPDRSLLFRKDAWAPFAHGSIMYRQEAFLKVGGYRGHCTYFEDVDLYLRMARHGRILVVPEVLFTYRFSLASGRLNADLCQVEDATDHYLRRIKTYRPDEDTFPPFVPDEWRAISPLAVISMATMRLWSGERPSVLGRLRRRAAFGWNRETLLACAWGLWASVSPATLRFCLRGAARRRDRAIARRAGAGEVYEWRLTRRSPPARAPEAAFYTPAGTPRGST